MTCPSCGAENAADAIFCEECGAQLKVSPAPAVAVAVREGPLPAGELIDSRYRVEELLEQSRIARYRAVDEKEEADCLLLEAPESEPGYFSKQAEILAGIDSAEIWRPTRDFRSGGRDHLAGPLPGQTVARQVESSGAMAPEQAAELGISAARALEALHEAGQLHRAVTPQRLWLTGNPEQPVTLECFGRLCGKAEACDNYEVTSGFSPPECYGMQGGVVDERSDVFGLGAVLHFAVTADRSDLEARETFFSFTRPRLPRGQAVVDVIMRAVAKSPDDRYQSAAEMRQALENALKPAEATTVLEGGGGDVPSGYLTAMRSDIGCVRSVNQDACIELKFASVERDRRTDAHLVAVIDGMGGEAEGDKAASLALRSLAQEVVNTFLTLRNSRATTPLLPDDSAERNRLVLKRALENANRIIHEYAGLDASRRGMGCTITAALIDGNRAYFGHVGDTRGYLFRKGELDQITTDHSLVGRLVQMGQMTVEEARTSPQRSIIYRAMGTNPDVEVDIYERTLRAGDLVMMSSDGVWEYFEASELVDIFSSSDEPHEIVEKLVETCLSRGADDNATVAVIKALA